MPERFQRRRTKGWRMPEGAIYVGRPSLWGNPYTLADARDICRTTAAEAPAAAVRLYRRELEHWGLLSDRAEYISEAAHDAISAAIFACLPVARNMAEYAPLSPLRGHDLVCWCPLDQPCHADVLLELANA